jgi:hypothetical protein
MCRSEWAKSTWGKLHLIKLFLLTLRLVELGLCNHFLHHFFLALDSPVVVAAATAEIIPARGLFKTNSGKRKKYTDAELENCGSIVLARDLLVELLVVGKLIVKLVTALGTSAMQNALRGLLLLVASAAHLLEVRIEVERQAAMRKALVVA